MSLQLSNDIQGMLDTRSHDACRRSLIPTGLGCIDLPRTISEPHLQPANSGCEFETEHNTIDAQDETKLNKESLYL